MAQQTNKENAFDCFKEVDSLLTLKHTVEQLHCSYRRHLKTN